MWASIYSRLCKQEIDNVFLHTYKWWCIISLYCVSFCLLLDHSRFWAEKRWEKNSHHADLNDRIRESACIKSTKKKRIFSRRTRWLWSACMCMGVYKYTTQHSTSRTFCIFVLKIEWFIAVSLMENVLNLYRSLKIRQRQHTEPLIYKDLQRARSFARSHRTMMYRSGSLVVLLLLLRPVYTLLNRLLLLPLCRLCGHILFLSLLYQLSCRSFFFSSLWFVVVEVGIWCHCWA